MKYCKNLNKESLEMTLYSRAIAFSACSFESSEGDVKSLVGICEHFI
jgi:hypothetical protein